MELTDYKGIWTYAEQHDGELLGVAIGFAGVLIINLQGAGPGGSLSLGGEGLILLSTISAGMTPSLMTRFMREGDDQLMLSGWQFFLGGLILTAGSLAAGARLHLPGRPLGALGFCYAAAVSTIALIIQGKIGGAGAAEYHILLASDQPFQCRLQVVSHILFLFFQRRCFSKSINAILYQIIF